MTEGKYINRAETMRALRGVEFELEKLKQFDQAKGVIKAIDRMMQVPVIYVDRGGSEKE